MSENKFIAKLKGEPTPKSVVEIQNDRLVAPFKSSPMGHIADRDSSIVVAKGAQNWAVNQEQLVPVADDYIGTESDLSGTSRVSGAGLWLNATYTFPATGDETNPVSAIIAPSAKWVLTLCGDSLITQNGSVITLTMLVKIGATHLTTKQFKVRECASQFSQRLAIDFSESEQSVIKAHGGSPLTVQVLCDDEGASATIYSGMTHLTLLQRKIDADLVATDNVLLPEFIENLLEGYIIPADYFSRYEYLEQVEDGGKAMPEFTRNGDSMDFTGWFDGDSLKNDLDDLGDQVSGIEEKIPESASATNQLTTKEYVDNAILALPRFRTQVVDSLPSVGEERVLYLVKKTGTDVDSYDEYIWVPDVAKFEYVGTTQVDLSAYATTDYVDTVEQEIRADMNEKDSQLESIINEHAESITTIKTDLGDLGEQVANIESKIPDSTSDTNPLINKQQLLDEEMDIREDLNEGLSELQTQITAQAAEIATKQDQLTAGDNIIISNNVISATGAGGGAGFDIVVVQELPATGQKGIIYLLAKDGTAPDVYDEYVWIDATQTFELIGTTQVDLTGYATKEELNGYLPTTGGTLTDTLLIEKTVQASHWSAIFLTFRQVYPNGSKSLNIGYDGTSLELSSAGLSRVGSIQPDGSGRDLGSQYSPWKKVYAESIINGTGGSLIVPTQGGTLALAEDIAESVTTKDVTVGTDEGTLNIGITAGVATIATNNGLDIVAQTKFDTAPTTDDTTAWADVNPTALVTKQQVATAVSESGGTDLPDQTGNAGKFLMTDGESVTWSSDIVLRDHAVSILATDVGAGAVAIGASATALSQGIAIGFLSSAWSYGVAIGTEAKALASRAIQLGKGTNNDNHTFKVGNINGNFEMMSADGTIPAERMSATAGSTGQVLTKTDTGMAWADASGGDGDIDCGVMS